MERNHPTVFLKTIFLLLWCFLCNAGSSAQAADQPQGEQKFQGFNLEGFDEGGEKAWEVNGDTADIQGMEIKLSHVDANSYGKQKMNVTAQTGYMDQVNGKMRLEKDVVITSETGSQLLTDKLDWDKNNDLVSTKEEVVITDEHFTASGKGMRAKPGLKNAILEEDVRVHMKSDPAKPDTKPVTITSDGPMEMDQAKSLATFQDNVYAVQEDQTLKTDRMEVYFDAVTKTIAEIICIGNVEIQQGENKSLAEKAQYKAKERKLILTGRPKVIMLTEGQNAITPSGN